MKNAKQYEALKDKSRWQYRAESPAGTPFGMDNAFKGQVVLVTGSSRGIGAAVARAFAAAGAAVAVHGRDREAVDEVSADIVSNGGEAIGVVAELTDDAAVAAMRDEVERALGPIDVLVANAGGNPAPIGVLEETSEEDWLRVIDVNLNATFRCVKAVLPGMKERGRGVIVTVSSAASRRTTARSPVAYAAAKAGIESLTRSIAVQAGNSGVRAVCVSPETILTERNEEQIPDSVKEQLRLDHPIQRLGTPDDVAGAALFLASDAAGWISGSVLDIAGGSVLVP